MRTFLIGLNLALLGGIIAVALFWHPVADETPLPGTHAARMVAEVPLAAPPQGGDFTLDGPDGPVSLADLRGHVVLLYFGYTYCPDVCPTSLTVWAQALSELTPAERARVRPIFVSVDPERDDVARLRDYTQFFDGALLGLTGPVPRLREIAARYGAVFARQENVSAGGYTIDHTAATYVIDTRGSLVETLPHGSSAAQLMQILRNQLSINQGVVG